MFANISFVVGISFLFGIALAIVILAITRRGKPLTDEAAQGATPLGWWTLAFGLTAAMAFALSIWWPIRSNLGGRGLNAISIAFAFAAVVDGIGNLMRQDFRWPTWVGILAGLVPAVFWLTLVAVNSLPLGK